MRIPSISIDFFSYNQITVHISCLIFLDRHPRDGQPIKQKIQRPNKGKGSWSQEVRGLEQDDLIEDAVEDEESV